MTVTVTGMDRARELVNGAAERSRRFGPLLEVLTEELRALALESFATERGPSGRAWAPRAAEVRASNGRSGRARSARRAARAAGDLLLVRTGELISSIAARVETGAVVVEAMSGHAKAHQFGTRHVPARPFLPVTKRGPLRSGPGGVWWRLLPRRIAAFVARGEL